MKTLSPLLLALAATVSACAYAPGGVTADGKVIIAKNNTFLFGALNKIYVCTVTPSGLTGCNAADAP